MKPSCSFCGGSLVVAWFEGPHFQTSVDSPDKVRADEAWLACSTCLDLVEAGDRDGLVQRGIARVGRRGMASPDLSAIQVRRQFEALFWTARSEGQP
jgi:hypothetical protein